MALEGVVHQLGGVEELLAAHDDLPLGLDADVAHERHERVEDLGHATAERGRREVEDLESLQLFGKLVDLLYEWATHEMRVVGQGLVAHSYGLQQGAAPFISSALQATHRRPRRAGSRLFG